MPAAPDKSFTSIVRAGLERACRDFTARVEPLGFRRTLKVFWTRRHLHTVDFIHFHRSGISYGASRTASVAIRVHFGIRVLNDDYIAAALNGPHSDAGTLRAASPTTQWKNLQLISNRLESLLVYLPDNDVTTVV